MFCRNVLIYFDRDETFQALSTIAQALAPHGLLVLEASGWLMPNIMAKIPACSTLELVDLNGVFVYQKGGAGGMQSAPRRPAEREPRRGQRFAFDPVAPPRRLEAVSAPATADLPIPSLAQRPAPSLGEKRDVPQEPLLPRADRLLDLQRPEEALALYREALNLDDLQADLYLRCGICHLLLAQEEEAKTSLRQALFLEPALWPAAWLLGDLWRTGDEVASFRYLTQARDGLRRAMVQSAEEEESAAERLLAAFVPGRALALDAVEQELARLRERIRGAARVADGGG